MRLPKCNAQVECLSLLGYLTEGGNLADAAQAFLTEALECGDINSPTHDPPAWSVGGKAVHGGRQWVSTDE
jgi:hypothetical protein